MTLELAIAGGICIALALGHETIGTRWVLPGLDEDHLPGTPFGSPSMTLAMIRVTWHVVTIFALGVGGVLVTLAGAEGVDPKTVVLRWFAALWVAATAMTYFVTPVRRHNVRNLLRLPVPLLWMVVAALCWKAST